MTSAIYSITNGVNGHRYIGSAMNMSNRRRNHRGLLRLGTHPNCHLQRAWNKYGEGAFLFEVLEECKIHQLIEREQWWVDAAQPEYNICRTAGSNLGIRHSSESRANMSAAHMGKSNGPRSQETRAKLSAALKGRTKGPLPAECRAKISAALSGREPSMEHRARISAANKGKKRTIEQCANMSAARKGKKLSDEHRARISIGLTGKKPSEETRAKLSVAAKGRKLSKKQKAQISAYWKGKPWTAARRAAQDRRVLRTRLTREPDHAVQPGA